MNTNYNTTTTTNNNVIIIIIMIIIIMAMIIITTIIVIMIAAASALWLRTNGVSTNEDAAKAISVDRLGKKVRPDTFGKIKVGSREYPICPSVNMKFAVTPLVLTPFVPFRALSIRELRVCRVRISESRPLGSSLLVLKIKNPFGSKPLKSRFALRGLSVRHSVKPTSSSKLRSFGSNFLGACLHVWRCHPLRIGSRWSRNHKHAGSLREKGPLP